MVTSLQSRVDLRRRTHLALAIAARDIHDYAATINTPHTTTHPGLIAASRKLATLTKRHKILAVLAERIIHGRSWRCIAQELNIADENTARALYSEAEQRWRSGDHAPWNIEGALPIEITAENIDDVARRVGEHPDPRFNEASLYPGQEASG